MTAFDDLLASQSPAFVVLAEIQPAEELGVWTAAGGGLTNTWYAAWSSQYGTSIVRGGLYRRLDSVKVSGSSLTSRASAALVNANAGSYFHDTANNRIYVHTPGSLQPDTYAFVGAWFTLFFSTVAVSFSDQPVYSPLLSGELPTIDSELADPVFGGTIASDTGSLSILNGDGFFDSVSRRWIWKNKAVSFKLGGTGLAYSDFAAVGTLRINNVEVDDEALVLQLESSTSGLALSIPTLTFGDDTEVAGQPIPLLFGAVSDIRPPRTTGETYYIAAGAIVYNGALSLSVSAVYAIHKTTLVRTLLTITVDYTVNGAFGASGFGLSFTITNPTYTFQDYEIRCDATTGAFPGDITTALLRELGEHGGFGLASMDSGASPQIGFYVTQPTPGVELLRQIEVSLHCRIFKDDDGLWQYRPLTPDGPAGYTLTDQDFVSWKVGGELVSVLNEVRVAYDRHPADDTAAVVSSSASRVEHAAETADSHTVRTVLGSTRVTGGPSTAAATLASRLRSLKGQPEARIEFEERGLTLMRARVGDLVAVTRARGPIARTGRLNGQLLRIVALSKALGPDCPVVRGVLADIGGLADRVFRLAPAGSTIDWATATAAERAYYGFLSDANGYIDPADPLTKYGKVLY